MKTKPRERDFAAAIIKVGRGITREKRWLQSEIKRRLPKLYHSQLCAVKDLVTTMVKQRDGIGPRNRRFMTRKKP